MQTKRHIQFWTIAESEPSTHEDLEEGVGPYLLATMAKRAGYTVSSYQASQYGCDAKAIVTQIKTDLPDILALSIFSGGIHLLREVLGKVDNALPVMIGGPGATSEPARVLSEIGTSRQPIGPVALVQSEGESAFAALLASEPGQWGTIPQCWRLSHDGKILSGQFGALRDLDEKPLVDLSSSVMRRKCEGVFRDDAMPLQQRIRAIQALQHCYVETRRGCFFKCEFCSEPQLTVKGVRKTSPARAIQEVQHLFENFGITFFNYADNIAFDDEVWWRTYAELLQQLPYHHLIQFGGYGTPKFFSKKMWFSETLPLLCRAGLCFVTLGVQSGSRRILKDIIHRPPDDPEKAMEVVRQCAPLGLNVKTDFIVGHPTETIDDLKMTHRWVRQLYNAGAQVFVRRLGIVPKSGYDFRLRDNFYTPPAHSEESEGVITDILWYHSRKDNWLKAVANTQPNLFLIDREQHTLFPKPRYDMTTLLTDAKKVVYLPEPLRERFTTLFELVIRLKSWPSRSRGNNISRDFFIFFSSTFLNFGE